MMQALRQSLAVVMFSMSLVCVVLACLGIGSRLAMAQEVSGSDAAPKMTLVWDGVVAVPAIAGDAPGEYLTCSQDQWFREPPEKRAPVKECRTRGGVVDKQGGALIGPVTLQEVLTIHMGEGYEAVGPLPVQVYPGVLHPSQVLLYIAYRKVS